MIKCIFTALLLSACLFAKAQVIHFNSNSAFVADSCKQSILQHLNKSDRLDYILVTGFTDSSGRVDSNLALAGRRANAVRNVLLLNGVAEGRIKINAMGAAQYVAANTTAAGRSMNRRVEIAYILKPFTDNVSQLDDIELLYQQLKDSGSRFCINPLRDTVLVANKGSIIIIPAHTFIANNSCTCISLVFHEYFSKKDMLLNNLTTTSNGLPLASGGMTKLEAYCGDSIAAFNNNSTVTIMVPTPKPDKAMSMYTGDRQLRKQLINWADAKYKTVTIIDKNGMKRFCRGSISNTHCPFFFCKIRRFFNNNAKSSSQRRYDKAANEMEKQKEAEQEKIKQLGLRPDIMANALQLSDAKDKDAVAYYVFKNASFSYHNIDRLLNGEKFTPFYIDENFDVNKDIRIVLKDSRSVLPAVQWNNGYKVNYLFSNVNFTIIGLQLYQGRIQLAQKATNSDEKNCTITFKDVSIEELNSVLNLLDKK